MLEKLGVATLPPAVEAPADELDPILQEYHDRYGKALVANDWDEQKAWNQVMQEAPHLFAPEARPYELEEV